MDARVDEAVAGQLRLVADLVPRRIGEGVAVGVLGPLLVDLSRRLERHRLPGLAGVVGGVPVEGGAARDVHPGVDSGRGHALGELVLAGDVGAGGLVEIADQVHVPEVQRRRVVGFAAGEPGPDQDAGGEVRQVLLLGRHDGVPGCPAVGRVLPGDARALGHGRVLVEVELAELDILDRLEADLARGLEVVAVDSECKVGGVERRPGLGIGAFQQHARGVGLARDGAPASAPPQSGDAHAVLVAVGQEHDRVAGVRLGVDGIVEGDPGFLAEFDLVGREDLLGQHDLVGQACGDAADLNGDRDGGVLAGELDAHGRDDAVAVEAEGLGQGVALSAAPAPAPDGAHDGNADDPRRRLAHNHDALDAGDHQWVVHLQSRLRGAFAVAHLNDAAAAAGPGGHEEGRARPSDRVGGNALGDRTPVAAHGDPLGVGREVGSGHGDAGLSPAADIGRRLHRRLGRLEDRVGVDVLVLGPVRLLDQHRLGAGQQDQARPEQRPAGRAVHLEHGGRGVAAGTHEPARRVDASAPLVVGDVGLGVAREIVRVDALLGLGIAVLQFARHLQLRVVVLEVLDIPDDLVNLVHGHAGQPEFVDPHVD